MTDIESRLRALDLRAPAGLEARALARAAALGRRPRRRYVLGAAAGALLALLAYASLAIVSAPQPAHAAAAGGYGVGEGCWFVRDADGVHFHIGGWYHGLPALCTSEQAGGAPSRVP
jgi:hypothetical protein